METGGNKLAFLGSIKRECDIRNKRNRNVNEYSSALCLSSYWSEVIHQNILITGGNEYNRNEVLAEAIKSYRERVHGPIIILNGSRECEKNLVSLANTHALGKLIVSSPYYKNYDLFYGMPDDAIRFLFEKEAQKRGTTDITALGDYTEAFLKILKKRYAIDFHSMFAMARQNDTSISELGRSYHINDALLNHIKNGIAGSAFRRILTDFGRAFLSIHGKQTNEFSLSKIDNSNTIYLIWTDSENQELFNEVLAKELTYLRNAKGIDFLLVINDIDICVNDPLIKVITTQKKRGKLGVCSSDVMTYAEDKSVFVNNFPALVVLNSGIEDYEDQQNILAKYGTYIHYEPTKGVGGVPGLFQLPGTGAPHMGMIHMEKQRVTVEDMARYAIAVRGNQGDTVSLYRKIRNM